VPRGAPPRRRQQKKKEKEEDTKKALDHIDQGLHLLSFGAER
jgi:hypothetical protein